MTSAVRWDTHYDTLGVRRTASRDKIKLTYYEVNLAFSRCGVQPDSDGKITVEQEVPSRSEL